MGKKFYSIADVGTILGKTYQQIYYAVRVGITKPYTDSGDGHIRLFDDIHVAELKEYFNAMDEKANKERKEQSLEAMQERLRQYQLKQSQIANENARQLEIQRIKSMQERPNIAKAEYDKLQKLLDALLEADKYPTAQAPKPKQTIQVNGNKAKV